MLEFSKNELGNKAGEMNFVRDTLEKVLRLSNILNYLNSNPLTREHLALKGGTAINLTVFRLPRLSVDIDLDFSKNLSLEDMTSVREQIREDIKTYMATDGYYLSPRSKGYHSLDSFVFSYINLGGVNDNIKIEINYSLRAHIFIPKPRHFSLPELNEGKEIIALAPMELFAAKINALLGRAAARDLYDIYNMIKYGLFDESELPMLRKCTVFYTAVSQDEIPDAYDFNKLNAITLRKIKTDLLPVIKKGEHFDLETIRGCVTDYLKDLLTLEPNERQFLADFKNKQYNPQLLFDDNEVLERIKAHPMAIWKMR